MVSVTLSAAKWVTKWKKCLLPIGIYIYISVAKPDGRFGQKLESLQAGQESTGQGKTGQDRAGQRDRSKAGRAKVEQSVGKSREGHDGHGHFAI